jgi:H+/gluconate symporter-like permease
MGLLAILLALALLMWLAFRRWSVRLVAPAAALLAAAMSGEPLLAHFDADAFQRHLVVTLAAG